ncbi:di/tri peptide transporter 2 [Roridomyces roridus]|uniref:Di/tri peptide transporter 2 n=1 Tax=Roridomyces roridus TaxID=1738132 RepID=A0AAD7BBZ5_9AGAR|nr:di/tri peptide transporter 2 [Roridomyces roridus]
MSQTESLGDKSDIIQSIEDTENLRHVGDKIPTGAWLVAFVALCERFTYYGISAPLQNYMQNSRDDPLRPGALGLGESTATRLSYLLTFLVYLTSFGGAAVADGWLGRYSTLSLFACIYLVGTAILFATSLPVSLDHGAGFGGLIAAIVIIGIGAGGMKSNLSPFIADQLPSSEPRIVTTSRGERVIVDQEITLQNVYSVFYWCTNVGSLSGVAAVLIEKYVAFWVAFLLPLCSLCVALVVLFLGRSQLVKPAGQGTILPQAFKALWLAVRGGFKMDAALPESDASFISELKRGLLACRVFLPWPILLLCQSQMSTNLVSQAATMETHGLPNDIMSMFNPITVVLALPLAQYFLYPALRKAKITVLVHPINRMALGFLLESFAQASAAGVQAAIYAAPPCFSSPLKCPASPGGSLPNHVNVFAQVPFYVFEGLGEVFSSPSTYEYAYSEAPTNMKSIVQAVFVGMGAFAVALGFAVSPLYRDPLLVASYAVLSGVMGATALIFWVAFRGVAGRRQAVEEEVQG